MFIQFIEAVNTLKQVMQSFIAKNTYQQQVWTLKTNLTTFSDVASKSNLCL